MSGTDIQPHANTEDSFDDWDIGTSPVPVELSEPNRRRPSLAAIPVGPSHLAPQRLPASAPPAKPKPQPIPMQGKLGHFPAFMSRSALFGVARLDKTSLPLPLSEVMAQGKYELEYAGPQLTMMDKAVWQAVVDMAKEAALDLNEPLHAPLSEIGTRIGCKSDGGRVLNAIRASLKRLVAARIDFTLINGHSGSGNLLLSANKVDGGSDIRFDPDFALPALGLDLQFLVDPSRRRSLDSSLSQWLHDFLSTHSEERPLTLGYLRDLCGFGAGKQRFPQRLEAAMKNLQILAPTLVAGFDIKRIGRDSDRWQLAVTRGTESSRSPIQAGAPMAPKRRSHHARARGCAALASSFDWAVRPTASFHRWRAFKSSDPIPSPVHEREDVVPERGCSVLEAEVPVREWDGLRARMGS